MYVQAKPALFVLWILGISLGCGYSLQPIRLKSRGWLSPVSLFVVLAFFPVLFAYYAFTAELNLFFLLSLAGLALTVYGVIISTEIRDYFGDKAMGIKTFTVTLGLVKASILAEALLTIEASMAAIAFLLQFAYSMRAWLSILLLEIPVVWFYAFKQFRELHTLSQVYLASGSDSSTEGAIMSLSSHNPRWIMIITQTYSAISIVLLLSKFLL